MKIPYPSPLYHGSESIVAEPCDEFFNGTLNGLSSAVREYLDGFSGSLRRFGCPFCVYIQYNKEWYEIISSTYHHPDHYQKDAYPGETAEIMATRIKQHLDAVAENERRQIPLPL